MYIVTDIKDLIGLSLIALITILFLIVLLVSWLKERIKDKWCKHDWKLYDTFSYGSKARYECTKCRKQIVK